MPHLRVLLIQYSRSSFAVCLVMDPAEIWQPDVDRCVRRHRGAERSVHSWQQLERVFIPIGTPRYYG